MADPSIEEQARFYDGHWAGHEFAGRLKLARATAILEELYRLDLTGPPRIVDLGCGTGWLTAILGQFGPATGLELSPAAVAAAAALYPKIHFEAIDLSTWVPEGVFDVVVSQEVLEHLDDQLAHVVQARDLLAPGGHLILTTPNLDTFDALSDEQRAQWSRQPLENWVDRATVGRLATEAGLDVVRLTTIIPHWGWGGVRTVANSGRLRRLASRSGLARPFDDARNAVGLGLHTLLVARRRGPVER